jgi:hypothetical protein
MTNLGTQVKLTKSTVHDRLYQDGNVWIKRYDTYYPRVLAIVIKDTLYLRPLMFGTKITFARACARVMPKKEVKPFNCNPMVLELFMSYEKSIAETPSEKLGMHWNSPIVKEFKKIMDEK